MRDLKEKEFSDLMHDKLKDLNYEQTSQNPTTETIFPCIELHNPLRNVIKTHNAFPIKTRFQFSITCWNAKKRACMDMTNEVESKLREYNLVRTNTSPSTYDSILNKHGITITFEVYYNALIDSFEFIK